MRESQVDKAIARLCKERGAYCVKIVGSAFQSGVPDNLICYKGTFVAIESKTGTTLSPIQRRNLTIIQKAGGVGESVVTVEAVVRLFDQIDNEEYVPTDYKLINNG